MKNLRAERFYLQGAIDMLLRLKGGYDMYLIPLEKRYSKTEADIYEYFPVTNLSKRRLIGDGVFNLLINDRKSLRRFLLEDYGGLRIKSAERNKNGKITRFEIELTDNDTNATME